MAKYKPSSINSARTSPPARTPEGREQQLAALAYDLVEKRLIEGTASSQETTHFLKVMSSETRLKNEIAELQKELIKAKTESIHSEKHREELFTKAIAAMKMYSGNGGSEDDEQDY